MPLSSESSQPKTSQERNGFNTRTLWPDMIKTPTNQWIYSCKEIVDRLGTDPHAAHDTKRKMEKCLMYFYVMRKNLKLFDHTYTAACILFFRYWSIYELPPSVPDCIHLAQSLLVTACKTVENNRPIDVFVKATCEFLMKDTLISRGRQNMEKLKWDVRDKLVTYEKQVLCQLGFDLNLENPKELIEEIFSGFYRYNRDYDMNEEFKKIFPRIIQEARSFIIQAGTQPVSLLCDGYTFTALALVFCGLQHKKTLDKSFRFPKNFFRERFPIRVNSQKFVDLFMDYRILETNFFELKSNKKEKLEITVEEIEGLIEEETFGEEELDFAQYSYESMKDGKVRQELLDHTDAKITDLYNKAVAASKELKKRTAEGVSTSGNAQKKRKV